MIKCCSPLRTKDRTYWTYWANMSYLSLENLFTRVGALQILIQEDQYRFVPSNLISLLSKAMAFIVKHHVFNDATFLLYRFDHFIGLGLNHSRIVFPLKHHQRLCDLIRVKER